MKLVPFQQRLAAGVPCGTDIVVHASTKPEPFGRTIVEAMACGRAAIVANAARRVGFLHPRRRRRGCDAWGCG